MDKVSKQIKSLEGEIGSVNERVITNNLAIEQTKTLVQQLESELKEVRVASCLEPSPESKSMITGIKTRLDAARNDIEELEIMKEALVGRKSKLAAELEALQLQAKQVEAERLAAKLPGLILIYNESIKSAFQSAVAAKALIQKVMELGGKQFIHELDSRGFDKVLAMTKVYVLADFKEGCASPHTLNTDVCDRESIVTALLS